jgi:type VI secretion system secreted protein Hcp
VARDIFLKLDGITGASQDRVHGGAIDVLEWEWKITQNADMHARSGGGSGKANIGDLIIEHYTDRASPNLMNYCLLGKPIANATLIIRKAGGTALEYYRLNMEQARITSVSMICIENMPCGREEVRLSFARFTCQYLIQNARGGAAGTVEAGFDIIKNCVI